MKEKFLHPVTPWILCGILVILVSIGNAYYTYIVTQSNINLMNRLKDSQKHYSEMMEDYQDQVDDLRFENLELKTRLGEE